MTLQQEHKRVQRAMRTIPIDALYPSIAAFEAGGNGLWCLVAGELSFIARNGALTETVFDDELAYAQIVRWVGSHPERVHQTHEDALTFVRAVPLA